MIYLIGGAPCSGKTFLAKALEEKLNIPILGTDIVRSWMQKVLDRADDPALFHGVDLTAEEYLTQNSPLEIVKREEEQQKVVAKGIVGFISANYEWDSYVIEGTGITPELIKMVSEVKENIKALVLVDKDSARIRKTIFTRGLWGEPTSYSDDLKEKEVSWVLEFNKWIENESIRFGTPYILVNDRETIMSETLKLLDLK